MPLILGHIKSHRAFTINSIKNTSFNVIVLARYGSRLTHKITILEMAELSEKQNPMIKIIFMREEYQKNANSGLENSSLSFCSIQHCLIQFFANF
jgi:hypothetical protein